MADKSGYPRTVPVRALATSASDTSDPALVWGQMDITTVFITIDDAQPEEVASLIASALARFLTMPGTPVDPDPELRVYACVDDEEARPC